MMGTPLTLTEKNNDLEAILLFGIWSLYFLHHISFLYFMDHLSHLRRYLDMREKYYKELDLLKNEVPFNPLKDVDAKVNPQLVADIYGFYL